MEKLAKHYGKKIFEKINRNRAAKLIAVHTHKWVMH